MPLSLLKTLEERHQQKPVSRYNERLLATLRSRCRLHYLAPPEQYADWLSRSDNYRMHYALAALRLALVRGALWRCLRV